MKTTTTNEITVTGDSDTVITYRHAKLPGLKIQTSLDQPRDPKSRWTAFASSEGVAIPVFAGKSYASQKSVDKAIRNYLIESASRFVPATKSAPFIPSTADDVLTW